MLKRRRFAIISLAYTDAPANALQAMLLSPSLIQMHQLR